MTTDHGLCHGCLQAPRGDRSCPRCGYLHDPHAFPTALAPGTALAKYTVGRVLGKPGGFGITYLAYDSVLARRVAVKELMPREIVARRPDGETLQVQTRDDEALFEYTRRSFLNEARLIAQLAHANVVRVLDYFEENGTAYFAMEYYEGRTLQEHVAAQGGRLPGPEAVGLILPVLEALDEIHSREQPILHRDIKPSNIYLAQKRPILLDFGAARVTLGEQSRSLSAVLTPGFAPYEQYSARGNQGPWTDVYGCAATLYFLVTGRAPPDASERIDDPRIDDPRLLAPDLSLALGAAIVTGLGFRPADRPQSAREFAGLLRIRATGMATAFNAAAPGGADAPTVLPAELAARTGRNPGLDEAAAAAVDPAAYAPTRVVAPNRPPAPTPVGAAARPGPDRRRWAAVAVGVLVLAGSAAAAISQAGSPEETAEPAPAVTSLVDGPTVTELLEPTPPPARPAPEYDPPPASAPTASPRPAAPAAGQGAPAAAATGILVVVYGEDEGDARLAETAVLRSMSGRGDFRPLDAGSLGIIRGDQAAVDRAIDDGDFSALASLGRQHGAEFLVVGDLSARAAPSFGQFFSGTAELDLKMYRVSTGSLVDAQVFRVGSGGNRPPTALNEDQARSQAAEAAGTLGANAARQWMNRALR